MSARSRWSLRRRLLVGIAVLLALVCAAIGTTSIAALRAALLSRLDDQVRAALVLTVAPQPQGTTLHRIGTLVLRVRGGIVVRAEYVGDDGEPVRLDREQQTALLALDYPDAAPVTVDLGGDLGEFRVLAGIVRPGGDLVVAGLPMRDLQTTTRDLAWVVAAITAAALLVAAVAGTQVVRVALRPLDRVTQAARRVAGLPLERGTVELGEGVPEADPRTEVGQLGAAFNRMLERVASALAWREASERKVRRFVADASHELRTPLAAIRGYAELTRRGGHELPGDVVRALDRIESESIRMTALVEDLLLLARLDEGRDIVPGEVDLAALAADAVSDAHAAAPDHVWLLDVPAQPVVVEGDQHRLQQVVGNLLANARLHTPPGTTVRTALAAGGDEAVVTVEDDGPGIPEHVQPVLFERFARGDDSRSRATGGTGLGLAIVAAVVEAHGGRVDVESRPGMTRFAVHLPRRLPHPASPG